jgi:hypothetical protein
MEHLYANVVTDVFLAADEAGNDWVYRDSTARQRPTAGCRKRRREWFIAGPLKTANYLNSNASETPPSSRRDDGKTERAARFPLTWMIRKPALDPVPVWRK